MIETVRHQCGVAAVHVSDKKNRIKAPFYLYRLLLNMQNRGQLSAGITTYNSERSQLIDTHKELGTVNEVFKTSDIEASKEIFNRYKGSAGIGHVRYATFGPALRACAQPFERHHGRTWKWFAFGFNGNIANYQELKKELMAKGDYQIVYDTDTEILMHFIARENMGRKKPELRDVFSNLAKKLDGAYSLTFINADGDLVCLRDPHGFRPLVYGEKNGVFMAASESSALFNCGIVETKSLDPGKMIIISDGKMEIKRFAKSKRTAHCVFEWVYFADVASTIDGKSVYVTRTKLGEELAVMETEDVDADYVVIPVPDTAKAAGDAMAYKLGIPAKEGLIRNRYVGRTFIEANARDDKVRNKYTAIRTIIEGKKVIVVDDSIVRGTTVKQLVSYLKKEGGAKEVHIRVGCPPIRGPCFYGIDMSTVSELMVPHYEKKPAHGEISPKIVDKIAKDVGADSLKYQTIEGLVKSVGLPKKKLCMACMDGDYPTECGKKLYKKAWRNFRSGKKETKRTYE